jgi:hypothetical protein
LEVPQASIDKLLHGEAVKGAEHQAGPGRTIGFWSVPKMIKKRKKAHSSFNKAG